MNAPAKKPPSQAWRQYPPAARSPAPALAPIHGPDKFSTKVPSGEAAEVIAKVLGHLPKRPPGR